MFLTFFKLPINYQELIQLLQYLKVRGYTNATQVSTELMAWNTWRKRPEKITKELADRHLRYPCPRDRRLSCPILWWKPNKANIMSFNKMKWIAWSLSTLPWSGYLLARVSFPPASPEACKVNKPSLPSPIPRQKNRKVGLVAKVKSRTVKLIIGSSRSHRKKCSLTNYNYRRKQMTPDTIIWRRTFLKV